MSCDRFQLSPRALGAVAQQFSGAPVQRSAAALQQALVGRVLDQRVLEAVIRPRSVALDEKDVGLGKPLQGRPKLVLIEVGDRCEERVPKVATEHGADLRDLPSGAEPVEPGGERLLQRRRYRRAPPATPRSRGGGCPSTNRGTPPLRSLALRWDRLGTAQKSRRVGGPCARFPRDRAETTRSRNDAASRSRTAKFRACSRDDQERACAPRSASARIRSSEVGSAQSKSSKAITIGCTCAPADPGGYRRQLPSSQFFRRKFRPAILGSRTLDQQRRQGRMFVGARPTDRKHSRAQ